MRDSLKSGELDNTSENNAPEEQTKIIAEERQPYQNEDNAAAAAPIMNSPG